MSSNSNDRRRPRRVVPALSVIAIALGVLTAVAPPAAADPPSNDHFAEATMLSGALPITASGTSLGATRESGEPDYYPGLTITSVWYKWTPAAPGTVVIDTCGSDYETSVFVYTGAAVDALTTVARNDDSCGIQSRVMIAVTAGTTYHVAVVGAAQGAITLHVRAADPPTNDDFADAQALSGSLPITATGTSLDATLEPGEEDFGIPRDIFSISSVWYQWTATDSREVVVDTCGTGYDTALAIWTGTQVDNLTFVAFDDNGCEQQSKVTFTAEAGMTYMIDVAGVDQGDVKLTVARVPGPANDDFADARPLDGPLPVTVQSTTDNATKQAGEPDHAGNAGGASVWYRWTPAVSGRVSIDTCGSGFNTLLAVYTGTAVDTLTTRAANNDSCGQQSKLYLQVDAGTQYRIAVDGFLANTSPVTLAHGAVTLSIRNADPPANDDLAHAAPLTGPLPVTASGSNVDATKQVGEPDHAGNPGGASVWFTWTPTEPGDVVVSTCGSQLDTLLAVYTGDTPDALTLVKANNNSCRNQSAVRFTATAETTYRIAVDGASGGHGSFTISVRRPTGPANDNFAAAEILEPALPSAASGTNVDASKQAGEPDHAGNAGGSSVWYAWTAAASGTVSIDTCDSRFDTLLAVYTGTSVGQLTEVAGNDDAGCGSVVRFDATAGTAYLIAVDGKDGAEGQVELQILPAVVNDDFADATTLSGPLPIEVRGTTFVASREPGEPLHAGQPGGASVWYRWTATTSAEVGMNTCTAGGSDTLLGVYTGDSLAALTEVAANDDGDCYVAGGSVVRFTPTAGTTYWIAIDGRDGFMGEVRLSVGLVEPRPPNDDFADAQQLSGPLPISAPGDNFAATAEPGEPAHDTDGSAARSIWYRWTPLTTGPVRIDTCTSLPQTSLAVYTGATISGLTLIARSRETGCGYDRMVGFVAQAGTEYRIAVDEMSFNSQGGTIYLHIVTPPANDAFASATVLAGELPIRATGTTVGATKEPGEPVHDASYEYNSNDLTIWYAWTATVSGHAVIDTCGSELRTALAVYTGAVISTLTPLVRGGQCSATIQVAAGVTYRIAIDQDGFFGEGAVDLVVRLARPLANDSFDAARDLGRMLPVHVTGTNVDASLETGEPRHAGSGGASVWYAWTAPMTGPVVIDTCGSRFDTVLGVYAGTVVSGLTEIASTDQSLPCGWWQSTLTIDAVAGTTYRIAVDGDGGETGSLTLDLRAANPPRNDDFANAQRLDGPVPITVSGSTVDATSETGEPRHDWGGGNSVWYSWTAPNSARVAIETCDAEVDMLLDVFRGNAVNALTRVPTRTNSCGGEPDTLLLTVEAGITYRILVKGYFAEDQGSFTLRIRLAQPPANDMFAQAIAVTGPLPITVTGSNRDAGPQPGEPRHGLNAPDAGPSVWFRWTAATTGDVMVEACGSGFATEMAVYTGASLNRLVPNRFFNGNCGDQQSILVHALAGTTYRIALTGLWEATGDFTLRIRSPHRPANDNFANAQEIRSVVPISVTGSNMDATTEPGEPDHEGLGPDVIADAPDTIWYRWTPRTSGDVVIETCGSDYDTVLAIYTGTAMSELRNVARNADACGKQSKVRFAATAGTTYVIAVASEFADMGRLRLRIRHPNPPQSDNFTSAQVLPGVPTHWSGTNTDATRQTGEPFHAGRGTGTSIWFRWKPAATGVYTITSCGTIATQLAIYTGTTLHNLSAVGRDKSEDRAFDPTDCGAVTFAATAGTTYHLAVEGEPSWRFGGEGEISLQITRDRSAP